MFDEQTVLPFLKWKGFYFALRDLIWETMNYFMDIACVIQSVLDWIMQGNEWEHLMYQKDFNL